MFHCGVTYTCRHIYKSVYNIIKKIRYSRCRHYRRVSANGSLGGRLWRGGARGSEEREGSGYRIQYRMYILISYIIIIILLCSPKIYNNNNVS